jgi:hypothetical protein
MTTSFHAIAALPLQKCSKEFEPYYDAAPDSEFAVVLHSADLESRLRLLPVADKDSVKISAAYLAAASQHLPQEIKDHAWLRILQRAERFNLTGEIQGYTAGLKKSSSPQEVPGPDLYWASFGERFATFDQIAQRQQDFKSKPGIKVSFSTNPYLSGSENVVVEVNGDRDLEALAEMADNVKLSSATRRQAALNYLAARSTLYPAESSIEVRDLPKGVRTFGGRKVSEARAVLFGERDHVVPSASCPQNLYNKLWNEYKNDLHLAKTSQNLTVDEAEVLALKISAKEEAMGVFAVGGLTPAHAAMFEPLEKLSSDMEGDEEDLGQVVYTVDSNIIRKRHLLELPNLRIQDLVVSHGQDFVDKLRSDPVGTFSKSPDRTKVFLARFITEQRSYNGASYSRARGHLII